MSKEYRIKTYPDGDLYLTVDLTAEEYEKFKVMSGDLQEEFITEKGRISAENVRELVSQVNFE